MRAEVKVSLAVRALTGRAARGVGPGLSGLLSFSSRAPGRGGQPPEGACPGGPALRPPPAAVVLQGSLCSFSGPSAATGTSLSEAGC